MNKETFDKIVPAPGQIGQSRGPLFWLLNKLELIKPLHTIVEIGAGNGGSSNLWTKLVDKGDTVISIDINGDLNRINWDYKNSNRNIKFIVGDSMDDKTVDIFSAELGNKKIDFLFIDGDHSYNGVSSDFKKYSPFVRNGGIVGFHDLDYIDITKFFNMLIGKKETTRPWMRPRSGVVSRHAFNGEFDNNFMTDIVKIIREDNPRDDGICTGIWWKV